MAQARATRFTARLLRRTGPGSALIELTELTGLTELIGLVFSTPARVDETRRDADLTVRVGTPVDHEPAGRTPRQASGADDERGVAGRRSDGSRMRGGPRHGKPPELEASRVSAPDEDPIRTARASAEKAQATGVIFTAIDGTVDQG
jgi:hypothetical protein